MFSKAHDGMYRPASRRVILLAVILLLGILVGALTLMLRQGTLSFPGTTRIPVSNAPIKNGLLFTDAGTRLKMFTEQVGWALVDSRQTTASTILRTIDGGHHWQDVTPAGFSGGVFYALDENTAWAPLVNGDEGDRTTDGGKTWQPMTIIENNIYDITFISQNEGWELVPPTYPPLPCKCPITPTPDLPSVVYHTLDGGKTWQKVGSILGAGDLDMHFLSPQIGWASQSEELDSTGSAPEAALYATVDGGKTWTTHTLPLPAGVKSPSPWRMYGLNFTTASTGYLFASFTGYPYGGISGDFVYGTRDAGNSWQVLGNTLSDSNFAISDTVWLVLDSQHVIYIAPPEFEFVGSPPELVALTLTNNRWTRRAFALPKVNHESYTDLAYTDFDFFSLQRGVMMVSSPMNGSDLSSAYDLYQTVDGGQTWTRLGSLPLDA